MITDYAAHFTLMGDSPTGGFIASNPAKGDQCGQVFAEGRTSGWGFGDPESPVGAVALGGPVGEPAQIVGAIFERGERRFSRHWIGASSVPGTCSVRYVLPSIKTSTKRGVPLDSSPSINVVIGG